MNLFPSTSASHPVGPRRAAAFSSPPRAPRGARRLALGGRLGLLGALLLCDAARAVAPDALPVDGQVREGGIAITRDARVMRIQQTGERAIVDWRSFDVGGDASVRIAQPSGGAMLLNRVRGETRSTIAGQLEANGQVYLVNPNGISISSRGSVSAAGFVASTLDIANRDFMDGNLHFGSVARPSTGTVLHDGSITSEPGGFTALLGHRIEQTGTTRTPLGQTGLGVGQAIRLLPGRDAFMDVTLIGRQSPVDVGDLVEPPASIVMTGTIEANGGRVRIAAPVAAHGRHPPEVIHLTGVVLARNAFARTGAILINGDGGIVRLAGRLDASSNEMHGALHPGGTVEISGQRVILEDQGIDVSGALGGGRVRIAARHADSGSDAGSATSGSDADGLADPMIFVGAWARIDASATYRGEAGDVRLASDGRVVFLGQGQALGATFAPGPSRLAIVGNAVVPDTDRRSAAATVPGTSVVSPMSPSASPPAAAATAITAATTAAATTAADPRKVPPTWHVSRNVSEPLRFNRQPSRQLPAPVVSRWQPSAHAWAPAASGQHRPTLRVSVPAASDRQPSSQGPAPAASDWQPSSQVPVSAASDWHSSSHGAGPAASDWQPTPDAAELPSLWWTPSPSVAPADVVAGRGAQG